MHCFLVEDVAFAVNMITFCLRTIEKLSNCTCQSLNRNGSLLKQKKSDAVLVEKQGWHGESQDDVPSTSLRRGYQGNQSSWKHLANHSSCLAWILRYRVMACSRVYA